MKKSNFFKGSFFDLKRCLTVSIAYLKGVKAVCQGKIMWVASLKLRNSWPSSYPLWKIAAGVDDVEFKGLPTEISDQVQRVVSTADESQVHIHPDTNLAVIKE